MLCSLFAVDPTLLERVKMLNETYTPGNSVSTARSNPEDEHNSAEAEVQLKSNGAVDYPSSEAIALSNITAESAPPQSLFNVPLRRPKLIQAILTRKERKVEELDQSNGSWWTA